MIKIYRSKELFGATRSLVVLSCLLAGCVAPASSPDGHQARKASASKNNAVANAGAGVNADAKASANASAEMQAGFYRVNPGDTIASIANAYGQDAATIAGWNDLPVSVDLTTGQVLRVGPPPGLTQPGFYRVNAGDTLGKVAAAYGKDVSTIAIWNDLPVTATLTEGQMLRVGPPPAQPVPVVLTPTNEMLGLDEVSTSSADASTPAAVSKKSEPAKAAACAANGMSWPVKGPLLTSFGKGSRGVVIGGKAGETIKAADSGNVVYAGNRVKGYGQLVIVKHDDHTLTAYGYNRRLLVKDGTRVSRGQAIAEMGGASGAGGGAGGGKAALLFEVRRDRKPVDPLPYLRHCVS